MTQLKREISQSSFPQLKTIRFFNYYSNEYFMRLEICTKQFIMCQHCVKRISNLAIIIEYNM